MIAAAVVIALVTTLHLHHGCNALDLGDCSKTTGLETLDVKKLEGTWYELESYGNPCSLGLAKCMYATFTPRSDGKSFDMFMDRVLRLLNIHIKNNWVISPKSDKVSGDLNLSWNLPLIGPVVMPLKVLGTDDYKSFVILETCFKISPLFNFNMGFILVKKRQPPQTEVEGINPAINEILKKNGIERSKFSKAIQDNCEEPKPPASKGPAGTAGTGTGGTGDKGATGGNGGTGDKGGA